MDTRSKRKAEEQPDISVKQQKPDPNDQKALQRRKNAEKFRKWRAKQKLDPIKYQKMKENDKERKKKFRKEQKEAAQVTKENRRVENEKA